MDENDEDLKFILKIIQEIKIAKFSPEINSLLQLPNNIINTLKADDHGNIWFVTSCNGTYGKNIDKSFYAFLDYYNKGSNCRLRIEGKAFIVDEEEQKEPFLITKNNYDIVLIKLQILKAEYFENKQIVRSFKEKIKNFFTQLFLSQTHKHFNFIGSINK